MIDLRILGIIVCVAVACLALLEMLRQPREVKKRYHHELRQTILQPDFVADLRKQLEKEIQEHLKETLKPLDKEVQTIIAKASKETANSLQEATKSNQLILQQGVENYLADVGNMLKGDIGALRTSIAEVEAGIQAVQQEYQTALNGYRQNVVKRVEDLVDEHATDLLVNYLHSSLAGIELGDQQEFILAKLDENKAALTKELRGE